MTKELFSLLSVSLGGFPFHAHLSLAFFFCSLVFLAGAFLAACFLPAGFSLSFLVAVPHRSFFKEFISAIMVTTFSCSSVGLPHAFSSSRSLASYLFSVQTIRSTLTLEVFDVDDKLINRGVLVRLPQVVEKIHCLLFPSMESAHLLADPLIEFCDISLENQQYTLGLYQHLPYVHSGCRIVNTGKDDYLLEE